MQGPPTCRIFYSGNNLTKYIDIPITRWDESGYDITVESFMPSNQRDTIFSHILPGEISEKRTALGWVIITDITYRSGATLILEPQYPYGISGLRERRVIGIKNLSDTFLVKDKFGIKIEGKQIRKWSDYT